VQLKTFGALLIGILIGVWIFREPTAYYAAKIADQAAEIQRLRTFRAREARRYEHPSAKVNKEAVAQAGHLLGTPPHVIAAIWTYENGPPDIETGVLGRTDYFAKHLPMDYWPAFEAGRTINIYTWKYLQSPEGDKAWRAILERAAKAYTGNTRPKTWADSVYKIEKELRR
jgi:hypothetical protein